MKIAYLSYERGIDLEKEHEVYYTDIKDLEKRGWDTVVDEIVAFKPDYVIEKEFDDGKALYMPLLHRVKEKLPDVMRAKWFINTPAADKIHTLYISSVDLGFFATERATEKYGRLIGQENVFHLPSTGSIEDMLRMITERKQI